MSRNKRLYTSLSIGLILTICASIFIGSTIIDPWTYFNDESYAGRFDEIISLIRIPKTLIALFSGIGLGLSGLFMQSLFRNPLAGPFVLGISSGASLGVALAIMGGSLFGISLNWWGTFPVQAAAFLGSMSILILVLIVNKWVKDLMSILIIGLMFSSLSSGLVSILSYLSNAQDLKKYVLWGQGNIGPIPDVFIITIIISVLIGLFIGLKNSKTLNIMLLGEENLQNLGFSKRKMRNELFFATCIMTATITAGIGPIAFIGLAVPHIARLIFQSSDHKVLLPATVLIGSILFILIDIIARVPERSFILPVNSISALIGAPVVIYLILKKNKLML